MVFCLESQENLGPSVVAVEAMTSKTDAILSVKNLKKTKLGTLNGVHFIPIFPDECMNACEQQILRRV